VSLLFAIVESSLTGSSLGPDQIPTLQDFHKMKFIRMVIKETLRVHHPCKKPPFPSLCVLGS
jgi:hypothetical protein